MTVELDSLPALKATEQARRRHRTISPIMEFRLTALPLSDGRGLSDARMELSRTTFPTFCCCRTFNMIVWLSPQASADLSQDMAKTRRK
jgi:hypothetical protein